MKRIRIGLLCMVCFGLVAASRAGFDDLIKEGRSKIYYRRDPQIEEARSLFSKALEAAQDDRQRARAMEEIAETYYRGRKYEKARAEDAKILALTESSARQKIEARFRRAESFMGYGFQEKPDYQRARAEYREVPEMNGATPEDKAKAVLGVGDSFATEKDYARARGEYGKIVVMEDIAPDLKVDAQYLIGANHRAEGDFEKARQAYQDILKMKEPTPEDRERVRQRIRTLYR